MSRNQTNYFDGEQDVVEAAGLIPHLKLNFKFGLFNNWHVCCVDIQVKSLVSLDSLNKE